jgi:hypothetical protein
MRRRPLSHRRRQLPLRRPLLERPVMHAAAAGARAIR